VEKHGDGMRAGAVWKQQVGLLLGRAAVSIGLWPTAVRRGPIGQLVDEGLKIPGGHAASVQAIILMVNLT
jgi:hypothetical protein